MPSVPWSVTWRKGLVSLPRLVPDLALKFTSPEGPHPIVFKIPSRGPHLIPLYVFIPPAASLSSSDPDDLVLPVLVDFHGGGFVLGGCQEQAPFCSKVCRELKCLAISVDYRLGPYAQFPAALEDAEDVINAILKPESPGYRELRDGVNKHLLSQKRPEVSLDSRRVALSGFSSGGNLALNLVMNMGPPAIEKSWPCPFPADYLGEIPVLMYYAAIDLRKLPSEREIVEGFHEVPKSFIASLQLEQHLMPTYLRQEQRTDLRASPALAELRDGVLHERARCLLILAERDSLSLQNEVWAKKATEAGRGKDVSVQKYLGVNHGWTQFPDTWGDANALSTKTEAHNKAVDFVRGHWQHVVGGQLLGQPNT